MTTQNHFEPRLMKTKLRPILIVLNLLLVSLIILVTGCSKNTIETNQPKYGPLEPPFSEIIPSAGNLTLLPYSVTEETIYHPDGLLTYIRLYGNEAASYTNLAGSDKPNYPAIVVSLAIRQYQDEEQAKKRIQEEIKRESYDKSLSESYAKLLALPLEDVACSVIFWKDPAVEEVQGEEEVCFRVGQYLGDYSVLMVPPPKLEDGYFMPPDWHDVLEFAAMMTDIPNRVLKNYVKRLI